jgi:signal transduction histidine kinase/CheY-like chemotaxis protein
LADLSRRAWGRMPTIGEIRAIAALLVVLITVATTALIIHNRNREIEQDTHSLLSYGAVLSEQTSRAVQSVQLVVDDIATDLTGDGLHVPADLERRAAGRAVHDMLHGRVSGVPQLDAVTIIGADGHLINFSRFYPIPPVNVSDRDYFKALRGDPKLTNFLSEPVQNRGTGTWTIYMAHKLTSPDGSFIGLVLGAMELSYFDKFYTDVDMGKGGTITLWRQDGVLLAHFPNLGDIGEQYNRRARFDALQPGTRRAFLAADTLDGQSRIVVVSRLATLPLVVGVTRLMSEVLADWRVDSAVLASAALVCILGVLAAMVLVTRQTQVNLALGSALRERDAAELGRREAEGQLLQAQKLEAIGRVAAGVAHDFNNLLMVVLSNAEMLGTAVRGDAQSERRLSTIGHAVDRGAALTQQMLAFSRQQILTPAAIGLNEALQAIRELLRSSLGGSVLLELDLAATLWLVHVDPGQLEHAILNLVINARDAMPEGGRMTIRTSNRTLAAGAENGLLQPGDYVELELSDTGVGMTDDVKARAFEPFFTTKAQGDGTGLGLSQVIGFVRQSHGDVLLESAVGRGTTVRILLTKVAEGMADPPGSLPAGSALRGPPSRGRPGTTRPLASLAAPAGSGAATPGRAALSGSATASSEPSLGLSVSNVTTPTAVVATPVAISRPSLLPADMRTTVLVVDDDDDVREAVVVMLEDLNMHVLQASSGKAALDLLTRNRLVRLMLTDYAMPGMTGVELAAAVRQTMPDITVVFMTGYARPEPLVTERWVIRKPFTSQFLADTLLDAIPDVSGVAE